MLEGLTNMEKAVNYMYGEMPATAHLRDRVPSPTEWSVAHMLQKELDYPCRVVVQTQDQGHWMMSDAMHRMGSLHQYMRQKLVEAEQEETNWTLRDEPPSK